MNDIQKKLRRKILEICYNNKEGHLGGCFSCVDIIYILYKYILRPNDKFILSKGHCSLALYTVMNEVGLLLEEILKGYCKPGSFIGGHCNRNSKLGIHVNSGSLGHGLALGIGMAIANPKDDIYVLMGDGECNEGSIWESLMFINHHQINNINILIDYNHSHNKILNLDSLEYKLDSFGMATYCMMGHDIDYLINNLNDRIYDGYQSIILNTTKGKGVSFMENNDEWHRKIPNASQYEAAMKELE